jgi:hypothetical protein
MNLAFEIEVPAKNFFLGGAKSLDDVPVAAGPAQRFGTLRCSPFHFEGDHDFLFSKKRFALRNVLMVVRTHRAHTESEDSRESQNSRDNAAHVCRARSESFLKCAGRKSG